MRGCIRVLFTESFESAANGCGCTRTDAERMKRRLSWTLRLHCHGTHEEFKKAALAVLEHHFDNHEHCGDWCKAGEGTEEESDENKLRFRCKTKDSKLHLFMKKHHEQFMEDVKLRQLFHQWDANAVEAFNKFLTKFLPKDRTHCKTNENERRSLLVAALQPQSIGCRQFCKRVFEISGLKLGKDDMTNLFLRSEDSSKLWRRENRRKISVKQKRMRVHYKKVRDGVAKLKKDNRKDLSHGSGMMGPGNEDDEREPQVRRQGQRRPASACKCGSNDHSRISHADCPKNPKNIRAEPNPAATQPGE